METEASHVLSSKQKSQTLRAKTRKPTAKAVLCTPYAIKWPPVSKETTSTVLRELKSVLSSVELRNVCQVLRREKPLEYKDFNKLKVDIRKERIKAMNQARSEEEKNLRGQLVMGFNAVSKALEQKSLRLVVTCRNSWDLVKHLAQPTAHSGCPGMLVTDLDQTLREVLGVSRLSAIGFKKVESGDSKKFDDLVATISALCSPVDIPWNDLEQELLAIKHQTTVPAEPETEDNKRSDTSSEDDTDNSETEMETESGKPNEGKPTDYSHLYVYKSQIGPRPPVRFQDERVTYIKPKADGLEQSDFVSLDEDNKKDSSPPQIENLTRKRKSDNSLSGQLKSSKKPKLKKSEYKPMVLGKVQMNSDRKSPKNKS